mmetsp:Transcript_3952/g.3364  ORF Transcript_3952/g.3364 Transcript_3952/m.3364 type:complete len:212 (-) Transcript_3952:582-1217(-)
MGDFWKDTAQMFGSLFEKPKMTEKLLCKPPFKYLFDIVNETRKTTGFAEGLYSEEELNHTFYDDKAKKMHFLKKIITLTSVMLQEEFAAKPNKIVAGVEPENTNILLQGIYRATICGQSSEAFVKKVLVAMQKDEEEVLGHARVVADKMQAQEERKAPEKEPVKEERHEKQPRPSSAPKKKPKQPEKPVEQPKREEDDFIVKNEGTNMNDI